MNGRRVVGPGAWSLYLLILIAGATLGGQGAGAQRGGPGARAGGGPKAQALNRFILPSFDVSPGVSNGRTGASTLSLGDYTGVAFANGVIHAAWADNSAELTANPNRPFLDVATTRITISPAPPGGDNTLAVSAPVNASAGFANESTIDIAVNPTDPDNLVVVSSREPGPGLFVGMSIDGGNSWSSRTIADGSDALIPGFGSPAVEFDSFGNCFLAYQADSRQSVPILLSTDGGASFGTRASLAYADGGPPSLATGPGSAGAPGSVWIAYANFGSDGTTPTIVVGCAPVTGFAAVGAFRSVNVPNSGNSNNADIEVGPNGQAVVTYQNSLPEEGPVSVLTATDTDGLGPGGFTQPTVAAGTSVGGTEVLPAQCGLSASPRLAWDRRTGPNGRLYLVYTDENGDETNDTEILLTYSEDSGATWSEPERLNDDRGTSSQFLPRIALDQSTGNAVVTWYDCAQDAGDNGAGDTDGQANTDVRLRATILSTVAFGRPDPPSGMTQTWIGEFRWDLTWTDNSNNEIGFQVLRQLPGEQSLSIIATVPANTTAYTDPEEQRDGVVVYAVRAYNLAGGSAVSAPSGAPPGQPPVEPGGPSTLTITDVSDSEPVGNAVLLNWKDNSARETGFTIERKDGNGPFVPIASVGSNVTSYRDSGVTTEQSHRHRVRSTGGLGKVFAEGQAILAEQPGGLQVALVTAKAVCLQWQDASDVEEGFRIERQTGSGPFSLVGTVKANTTTFMDLRAYPLTPYTYRVRCFNRIGKSKASNPVTATTLSDPRILGVSPPAADRGQTLNLQIQGERFLQTPGVSFGPLSGITVNNVTFNDAGSLTVGITIAGNAAFGPRSLKVTNPDTGFTTADLFSVDATPSVLRVNPCFAGQGPPVAVTITGANFQATPTLSFGQGVTVQNVSVVSPGMLTASVLVAAGATPGNRNVTLRNPDSLSTNFSFAIVGPGGGKLQTTAPKFKTTRAPGQAIANLKVQNKGSGPLTFCPGEITGPFRLTGNARPQVVPARSSALVPIAFTPPGRGTFRGSLELSTDDPLRSLVRVQFQGKGK